MVIYSKVNSVHGGNVMLVIGRKPGEYVMIGEDIKIQVVKSKDGDLRLAIEAPKSVRVVRGEIYEVEKPQGSITLK